MVFKTRRAQAIIEYIGLFIFVALTLFALLLSSVKGTFEKYHQDIVTKAASG